MYEWFWFLFSLCGESGLELTGDTHRGSPLLVREFLWVTDTSTSQSFVFMMNCAAGGSDEISISHVTHVSAFF